VIAVTSLAAAQAAAPGPRLVDHADVVLDLATPAADALVSIDGVDTPVSPGSSLAAVALANELKARTALLLAERGRLPPVITSAAVVGPERSAELFEEAYAEHARRLARTLRQRPGLTEEHAPG
jgi:uncharacterized phosphosugar-binding protein